MEPSKRTAELKDVANLLKLDQGPPCVERNTLGIVCGNLYHQELFLDRDIMHTAIQNGMENHPILPLF